MESTMKPKTTTTRREFGWLAGGAALAASSSRAFAQATPSAAAGTATTNQLPSFKQTTPIPPDITTPNTVDTRLGTLRFFDGMPDRDTVQKAYDNLDFTRGVESFLRAMPGASLVAVRKGMRGAGVNNTSVLLYENFVDSKPLWLTVNTETVTLGGWLDLKDGPVVMQVPPKILGFVDDFWFHYVGDIGNVGPDKGEGGKYLFVPPGHTGKVPEGYYVFRPKTNNLWFWLRAFAQGDDPKPTVEMWKQGFRLYPLAQAAAPPATTFINGSGLSLNTVHSNNEKFYEEVNQIVQEEPGDSQNPEILGTLAAIGIEKGKPFAPDARMQAILKEAAAVGNATARALSFRPRDKDAYFFQGKGWFTPFPGGSHEFLRNGATILDLRTFFFYVATGITPAMTSKMVGAGSQYAGNATDKNGNYLDGSKLYKLNLPPNVPIKNFWSVTVYDTQTRSELQTDATFPVLNSTRSGVVANSDGSIDLYFGPKAPAGHEKNWVQTVPGKAWWVLLRLYSPLEPWFDKTWQPGEFEAVS
jgi:hypothetical protein